MELKPVHPAGQRAGFRKAIRPWRDMPLALGVALGLALGQAGAAAQEPGHTPAPARTVHHRPHHHRHHVPAPPPRPAQASLQPAPQPANTYTEAPRPQDDLLPPKETIPPSTSVEPGNLQLHYPPSGDGYVRGSSPQAMDDERTAKFPGVTLHVPLADPAPQRLPPPDDPGH